MDFGIFEKREAKLPMSAAELRAAILPELDWLRMHVEATHPDWMRVVDRVTALHELLQREFRGDIQEREDYQRRRFGPLR